MQRNCSGPLNRTLSKFWIVLLLLGWALSVESAAAQRFGDHFKPETDATPSWWLLLDQIGASEQQVKTMQQLIYEHEKKAIDRQADLRKKRLELHRLLQQEKTDEAMIMKLVESIGAIETEQNKAHLKLLIHLKEALSKEQYKRLRAMQDFYRKGRFVGSMPWPDPPPTQDEKAAPPEQRKEAN